MVPLGQKHLTCDDELPSSTVTPEGDTHSESSDSDSDHSILDHLEYWEIPSENTEKLILPKASDRIGTGIGLDQHQRHAFALRSFSLDSKVPKEVIEQIDRDLPRTGKDPLVQTHLGAIRDLLLRHVVEDPELGYCQGMNYVAAAFSVAAMNQEDAYNRFYLFTRRLRNLWMPGFCLLETGMQQFEILVQGRAWYRHLTSLDVQTSMYLPQAWLTIFVKWLPLETLVTCLSFLERHSFAGLLAMTLVVLDGVEAQLLHQTCMDNALQVLGKLKENALAPRVLYDKAKAHLPKIQLVLKMPYEPMSHQNMGAPRAMESSFADWLDRSSDVRKWLGEEALPGGRAALIRWFARDTTSSRTITRASISA